MAMVNFKKGLLSALPTAYAEGTFYVTTDEHALYLDISGSERIRISDFQKVANMAALPAASAAVAPIYYIEDINCLAVHNGAEWIQVNRDTGMTSVEVTGTGNAVTAAMYTADGRKLTLTKGATFATREYVGEIPDGYTETTIVGFINKKAEEVLSQATGGSSESAASVKAALDTYKTENDAKVTQAQKDIDALEEKVGEKTVGTQIDEKIAALKLPETYDAKGAAATVDEKLTAEVARATAAEAKALSDAKAYTDELSTEVDATIGTVPTGKTVVGMIAEAQTAATYDDTKVKADIKTNADAIAKLNGDEKTEGSVKKTVADGIASVVAGAPEDFDTLKEMSDWIASHKNDATAMNSAISALEAIVAGIGGEGEKATVVAYVTDAIAALKIGDYAKAADLTALAARVTALEGSTHTHTNKAELDKISTGDKAKWDAAQANAEKTAADALATAKTELEGKITAAQTAAEKVANDNNAAMDTRVKALEKIDHEAYKAYADQAEADAKSHAESLLTWGTF